MIERERALRDIFYDNNNFTREEESPHKVKILEELTAEFFNSENEE
jgi:hypothetical protein